MSVPYKPANFQNVVPYLMVDQLEEVIAFAKEVFDAEETECLKLPDNKTVVHSQFRIGDSVIMMGKSSEMMPSLPTMIYVYVKDTDACYQKAIDFGAEPLMEPEDMFYGDRNAGVRDSQGVTWWIATHQEAVSSDELAKRAAAAAQQQKPEETE